jgi:hypothetical protein
MRPIEPHAGNVGSVNRFGRAWNANRAFNDGRRALDEGRLDEASAAFRRYLETDDDDPVAWFNLGLVYKFQRNWAESMRCNRRAAELDPDSAEAHWNMGVAATALRDWESARWAWHGLKFDIDDGPGPPSMPSGPAPVRLNATDDGGGEVVWGDRIDPCRMRLGSVPLPDSGHRWGDVVLHDVVPRGERIAFGRTFSVFDELERMEPSEQPTLQSTVTTPTEADIEELGVLVTEAGFGAEDWTGSLRWMCAKCSLSSPHDHDATKGEHPIWLVERTFGLAGSADAIAPLMSQWAEGGAGRAFTPPVEVG